MKQTTAAAFKKHQTVGCDPDVLQMACQRVQQVLGCSEERAFDLLYGAAAAQGGGLYELARILTRAHDVTPYLRALEKFRN